MALFKIAVLLALFAFGVWQAATLAWQGMRLQQSLEHVARAVNTY